MSNKRSFFLFFFLFLVDFAVFSQPVLEKVGTFKCGKQPKQVLFSPDNKKIIMPLLDENGFDIFDVAQQKVVKRVKPPQADKKGFAEGLFIPEKNGFFVSQMTTGNIYEYSYPDFLFRRTISTGGTWSKFIIYSPEKNILAVSNWVSNDISIIDYSEGELICLLKTSAAPRGMVFTDGGKYLISMAFDGGVIEKFDIENKKLVASIKKDKAAMRHIVCDSQSKFAYISDMYNKTIYKLDLKSFSITDSVQVFSNPNTIDLLDDKYLFVSSRGPNNQEDYTKRSPVNGKIQIIDISNMKNIYEFEGGNQPTGLDISSDGKYLCFSNFQDENIEIYKISYKKSDEKK